VVGVPPFGDAHDPGEQRRLPSLEPRSQPTAARIAGCRNRGSGLAIPGTDQPVQPRGVAQGLRRGRCNLNCTFRVPK
jgi:hypothetical protein